MVLYSLHSIIQDYMDSDEYNRLMKQARLIYIPVLNPDAYLQMQMAYEETGEFKTF